ncbi:MAG TPA: alpha-L-fucosidase [Bryobacteraceae bacterium]|nr:alpha-L-fucosidase [Bryobacteraceae bacterium]
MRYTRLAASVLSGFLMLAGCARERTYEQRLRTILAEVDRGVARGPFRAGWNSLTNYKVPQWYQDAKFGIFIHWGVYSVPAHANEWYPRNMYLEAEPVFQYHVKTYGPQDKFGYKDFIPRFTADKFDPDQWALLFRQAGAKFVVPVAEHHDGFPLYDCSLTDWSAAKMGPRRDVIGLLAGAIRRHGMVFGASSHRAEHWWFFEGGMQFPSDVQEPRLAGLYGPAFPRKTSFGDESQPSREYLDDWLARTAELVEKYRPELVWFDWWIEQPVFEPYRQRFAAYYYNRTAQWGREPVINYKNAAFPEKAAVLDVERGQLDAIRPQFWQTDTSISKKSWGYIQDDEFKSPDSIVDDLVDIVSKNGALLLNIGPRADGTIPDEARRILREIGRWLEVNGEAIYGTRPWKTFGEGPTQVVAGSFKDTERAPFTSADFRFTTKGSTLYAIALDWPQDGRLVIQSLAGEPVGRVELLGAKAGVKWTRAAEGLVVELPSERPCDHAYALRISPGAR